MKIALIIDRLDPRKGGGEGYTVSLAQALVKLGHEVHVLAQGTASPSGSIRFHPLNVITYPRWAKVLSLAISAHRAINALDCDVVQGFGKVPAVDVDSPGGGAERAWLQQEIRCRRGRGERIWTALNRTLSLKLAMNLLLERMTYRRGPLPVIVVNSHMVKEDLVRYHSLHSGRVEVIYHGVDLERFHPSCRARFRAALREKLGIMQGSVLLFVAHNFRLKGLGTLLGVLGRLRDLESRWNLVVVGRGKSRPYERIAAAMDIQDRVLFVGAQDAPEAFYGASDLLIHPTFYDPFGLVCLEAMACGVPVITTRFAGAHELIETGEEGWVVDDPEDDLALEEALRWLMTRVDLQVMGQKARRKAEHFSWDEHVGRLLAVYERARSYRVGLR